MLIARSYLTVRGLTAASVSIDEELINLGNEARSQYQKALAESRKTEEAEEAKLKAKEEEERMRQIAQKDKERKS